MFLASSYVNVTREAIEQTQVAVFILVVCTIAMHFFVSALVTCLRARCKRTREVRVTRRTEQARYRG